MICGRCTQCGRCTVQRFKLDESDTIALLIMQCESINRAKQCEMSHQHFLSDLYTKKQKTNDLM